MSMTVSVRTVHKGPGKAVGQKRHDLREGRIPKYVDRTKSHLNGYLIRPLGEGDLKKICLDRRKTRNTKRSMKSDAAIATTGIITFGKEAQPLIQALSIDLQNKLYMEIARRIAELLNSEVTGLVVHRDETAPHAHYQMPAYAKDGRPLSKVMTPAIAVRMQDVAGEVLKDFGLEITRGIKKATRIENEEPLSAWVHRSVKQLHEDLPREIEDLEKVIDWKKEKIQQLDETFHDLVEKRVKELTVDLKAQADQMRALPIGDVLERVYGATLHHDSKPSHASRQYILDDLKIGVSKSSNGIDEVWIDNDGRKIGGKGAIDLVMHLSHVDFKSAIRILIDSFDKSEVAKESLHHISSTVEKTVEKISEKPPIIPEENNFMWYRVRKYLMEVRAIPMEVIDNFYDKGKVFADGFGNAVFPREKNGAFLRGTTGAKFARTIGDKSGGPFVIDSENESETILVESPIDAISLSVLRPGHGRIIALGGNLIAPGDAREYVRGKVIAAFDNDDAGHILFRKTMNEWISTERLRPSRKDWNEDLQNKSQAQGQILAGDESDVPLDGLFSAKQVKDGDDIGHVDTSKPSWF